ncbi:MAG TPA: class I SAM-dependent methyltransferase [Thermoanaerobaculia bacterium]|nr:class I SAM-dependent methyltransferase [Thermoanaerobaculia bacterium]
MEPRHLAADQDAAAERRSDTSPSADPADPRAGGWPSLRIGAGRPGVDEAGRTLATRSTASSYDLVPYDSKAIKGTHPDRMATVAALYGLDAPPLSRCRVLELGCARGDNLMAMAVSLPHASFLGIDASPRQIEDGKKRLSATGLGNVELRQADILELRADIGEFDYIICHGVYSWVARPAADRILELSARHLSPNGVAYVSYNTYPGWYAKMMLREMMRFHVCRFSDPAEQTAEARRLIHFLGAHAREEEGTYRALFKTFAEHLDEVADYYLFHEFLEEHNEPVTFREFVARAQAAGLQYAGSASSSLWEQFLPDDVKKALSQIPDRISREQYLDYLSNQTFRRSLLCHTGVPLRDEPLADAVSALQATARTKPMRPNVDVCSNEPEQFLMWDETKFTTSRPLIKAVLVTLAEHVPHFLGFDSLWKLVRARLGGAEPNAVSGDLAQVLLVGYRAGILDLSRTPPAFASDVSQRPLVSALARIQAAEDEYVSTLLHGTMKPDDLERFVLGCLDGTRDPAAVTDMFARNIESGAYELTDPTGAVVTEPERIREFAQEAIPAALSRLAGAHLLIA